MLTFALALALAAEPLPVPADALAVVQVRELSHVRSQLLELTNAAAPHKAAEAAATLNQWLKPDGCDLFALDVTRCGYLAVLPTADGVTWAAYLPTRHQDRCRAALQATGRQLHLLDRPGFVVATPHEPTAERLTADPKPLTFDGMGEAADVFLGSDLGLFVNLPEVQVRYGGLLVGTQFALPGLLRSGAFGLPKLDARQSAQVAAVADGLIQAVVDGRGFAVGVNLGPSGVTVEAAFGIRPNTVAAKVLAGEQPSALPLLDAMPGGQSAYAAGRFGVELAKRLRTAFSEATPADDPLATHAEHGWATAGLSPGPTLEVCRPASPANWLRAVRKQHDHAATVQNLPLDGRTTRLYQAVVHDGRVFDQLGLTFDIRGATAGIADEGIRQAAHTTIKGLVGERVQQWLGVDGPQGLRVTAADWPTARALVDTLHTGETAKDDVAVQTIRRRLPAEASAVVLLDAARLTCRVGGLARGAVDELPAFPGLELPEFVSLRCRSPFLGLALVTRPTGGRATLVLPADALKASLETVR